MLASELFAEKWKGADIEISDIVIDSRKVKPGCVFICIRGVSRDGHDYASTALENGAAAVVVDHSIGAGEREVIYEDTTIAMAKIASKFYGEPEKKLHLIGVTGTNGKTTVTFLLKKILETAGKTVGIIGTNEITVGETDTGIRASTPTTPNSLELRKIFAKMLEMGAEYVVMEVSSHALDLHRVEGLSYDVGVFTNLTQDHLDYHKTMENYFLAKKKLFDISKKGVINADDEYGAKLVGNIPCGSVSVGRSGADIVAENIEIDAGGVRFNAVYKGRGYKTELAISGMFSVYNALCAMGAAIMLGISPENAVLGLAAANGVKGRLERVPTNTDYTVIIDYAHTPDGLENVLAALNSFKKNRVIALFGCGGDRDAAKRPIMGEIGTRMADVAIITSDNPRTEEPGKIIKDIVSGIKCGEYKIIENRRDAIRYALEIAQKDDIVLLAGKGQETYQIIGTEKTHFDEREEVRNILEGTAAK